MSENPLRRKLSETIAEGAILYDMLTALVGYAFGQKYVVRRLLDVGGQGILFVVEDPWYPEVDLVLKMPYVPYHRPAHFTDKQLIQSRNMLFWEAYILLYSQGSLFPEFHSFCIDTNPLLDSWWKANVPDEEPYLVMEYIDGPTLQDEISVRHHRADYKYLETLALRTAYDLLVHFEQLCNTKPYVLYTDLRPDNIMLAREEILPKRRYQTLLEHAVPPVRIDTPTRLIDAGSATPMHPRKDFLPPAHPAYVPPEYFECYIRGQPSPWPDERFVLYTLGKTMHQMLTALVPSPGQDPDFHLPILGNYLPELVRYTQALIKPGFISLFEARSALHSILASRGPDLFR